MGSGDKTTTVQQATPQPTAAQSTGQNFLANVVQQPPIFPPTPGQVAGIQQAYDYFGTPQNYQLGAEQNVSDTLEGKYLSGPFAQQIVTSLADPIFANFRDQILPGIRDTAQLSGQGAYGSRRDVANEIAIDQLGRQIALSAIAPVYNAERDRQLQAAGLSPALLGTEAQRIAALYGAGSQERGFYMEPFLTQTQAANALTGGPTGTSGTTTQTESQGLGSTLTDIGTTALLAYALYNKKT